jgi:transcriptional regulator with GAF, ATPase, and Fis domain
VSFLGLKGEHLQEPTEKKRGKFELAHLGVIFLDEIGDMPLELQAELLRVLQSDEFTPLGSEKDDLTNVKIRICLT